MRDRLMATMARHPGLSAPGRDREGVPTGSRTRLPRVPDKIGGTPRPSEPVRLPSGESGNLSRPSGGFEATH